MCLFDVFNDYFLLIGKIRIYTTSKLVTLCYPTRKHFNQQRSHANNSFSHYKSI